MKRHDRKVVSFFVAKREKMQNNLHMSEKSCTFATGIEYESLNYITS